MLGKEQDAVHFHVEYPALGWDEGNFFDVHLKLIQQVRRQPGSALGEVSNFAVGDGDRQRHSLHPFWSNRQPIISHPFQPFWYNPLEPNSSVPTISTKIP
jgi:hypothetical protein